MQNKTAAIYREGCWRLVPGAERLMNDIFNVVRAVWCLQKSVVISYVCSGMSLGQLVVSHCKVTSRTGTR